MDTLERLQILREIEDLAIDYWDDVDRNWGKNCHEYYTEDGSYTTSIKTRTGRDAIKAERMYVDWDGIHRSECCRVCLKSIGKSGARP